LGDLTIRVFIVKFQCKIGEIIKKYVNVACSTISSALLISHGMRRDTKLILAFNDDTYIKFLGERLKYVRPDCQSTAGILRKILRENERRRLKSKHIFPGIMVGRGKFIDLLKGPNQTYYSTDRGRDLYSTILQSDFKFIIGYPQLSEEELAAVKRKNGIPIRISLKYKSPGPLITLIHHRCDELGV